MKIHARLFDSRLQRLLGRINIGWRLTISIVVVLIPLFVLGYWYVQSKIAVIQKTRLERDCIDYLEPLQQFMRHVAEHRGLSNIYLHGNRAVLPQIRVVAAKVERDLEQLAVQEARIGGAMKTRVKSVAIRSAWTNFRAVAQNIPAKDSFAIHTALIKEALDLNDFVAETSGVIAPSQAETYYLMAVAMHRGADSAEKLGQLRGLASGLLQKGALQPAERLNIAIRVANVREQFESLKNSLGKVYHYFPGMVAEIEPDVIDTEDKLDTFLDHAERLSRGKAPGLTAPQLFAAGTAALDAYNKLDHTVGGIFERMMDRVIIDLAHDEWVAITLVAGAVAIALLIAFVSVRSVTGPVSRLIKVVDRLALGDDNARMGIDSGDEIGVLARHFDNMMDELKHTNAELRDSERKRSEEQLAYLIQFDSLTGLPNRPMLYDRLTQTLELAQRAGEQVGCMFVDLDHFKAVNDTRGHNAGDKLLMQVAERMRRCVRSADTVARLGGDEFAVVLGQLAEADDASRVAKKMVAALAMPFNLDGQESYISASIGIAIYPGDGDTADELLQHADTAMYQAKERGRDNYQFYLPQMNERLAQRQQLETSLRGALERQEFLLHYQPKVESGGTVSSFEALLRWRHPERGLVSPAEFVPVLEDTGLIVPVGEWVLQTVCAQIKAWQGQGLIPLPVAINVSARQFHQQHLEPFLAKIAQSRIDPALIKLELTESLLMRDVDEAVRMLDNLKASGVHLSLDDFGTGYSSLAYLRRFPLDEIKIDRVFIRDITTNPDDAEIILAIIRLARSLNLKVVAEGVETEAQLHFLRTHGCDEMQGYYFSRPLNVEDCTLKLRERRRLQMPIIIDSGKDVPVVLAVDGNHDYPGHRQMTQGTLGIAC